ncbi:MAG: hypothetical protein E7307_02460 [Butyrivibrio sp.]|nr:hypothetical protein [Butyrivibrio sp.]
MKALKNIKSVAVSLLVIILMLATNLTAYAIENESELSFNSVVEVESYSIEEGFIEAGKEATVKLTLRNANRNSAANNVVVAVSSDSGMVFPKYGNDNQFFVGTMTANSTTTITVPIVVNSEFVGDYVDFKCDIFYVSNGKQITNSSTMILPAQTDEVIEVSSLEVSAHAVINNKSLLSISYTNKGTDNINDAVIVVDGNVSESTHEIDLGSIVAGKAYNKDCNIIYTETGEQTISVMLKYTDVDGEQVQSDLGTFRVTVGNENTSTIIEKAKNPYLVWIGRGISAIALMAAAIVAFMYVRKR